MPLMAYVVQSVSKTPSPNLTLLSIDNKNKDDVQLKHQFNERASEPREPIYVNQFVSSSSASSLSPLPSPDEDKLVKIVGII